MEKVHQAERVGEALAPCGSSLVRILKVSQAYDPYLAAGGQPAKVKGLAEVLAARGHRVTVLTAHLDASRHAETRHLGGVEIVYLRSLFTHRALTVNPDVLAFCRSRLREFDVVHCYGLYDLLGPAVGAYARRWRIPYLIEPLGMLRPRDRSFQLKRAWRVLLGNTWMNGASRFIATSQVERAELLEGGLPEEKIALRYNGLALGEFRAPARGTFRAELGIAPDEPLVLFLGRLIPRKRVDLLIRSFAEACPQRGCLVIAGPEGEPGYLHGLQAQVRDRGLAGRAHFPGPLFGERKIAALADADLFSLPSRYENFGNAAAEAIACGTPVVVTDRCGIAEVVDGRAGLVVSCDGDALAPALRRLLDDRGLYLRLQAGCAPLARQLSWDGVVAAQEEFYLQATRGEPARSDRRSFYDVHPFDWVDPSRPAEIDASVQPALRRLLDQVPRESLILDVGCGPGRVTSYLGARGFRCVGLDSSRRSVGIMRGRSGRPGIVADNLALPVADAAADLVISDGVLHHTGDSFRAFAENCRVLKEGGRMYVAVYKPGGRYHLLYRFPGGLIRWAVRHPVGRGFVHALLLPAYFAVHRMKSRGTRSWRGARNLFYDYFVSPQVEFLSRDMVEDWCRRCGLTLCQYDSNPAGNTHGFVVEKRTALARAEADAESVACCGAAHQQ